MLFGKHDLKIHRGVSFTGARSRIKFENNITIRSYCDISTWKLDNDFGTIRIGAHSNIGRFAHLSAAKSIVIGENVLIGERVTIVDNYHGCGLQELNIAPVKRRLYIKSDVVIGDNVLIGDGVFIGSGVKIGNNAVIGANSVVVRDLDANTVYVGAPARRLIQK